jgi:hypothetical protein
MSSCIDEARFTTTGKLNFMRMMFAGDGMKPQVLSWDRTAPILISRLRREAAAQPGSPSDVRLKEVLAAERTALHGPGCDNVSSLSCPARCAAMTESTRHKWRARNRIGK